MKGHRTSAGFTLIELLIVVVVVAVLAAIAFPSYLDSVRKGRRSDAQQALMEAAHRMENFYARNATYPSSLSQIGYDDATWNDVTEGSNTVYYQIRVMPATTPCAIANCYTLESRNQNDQVNDRVSNFKLWSTGRKQITVSGQEKDGWNEY